MSVPFETKSSSSKMIVYAAVGVTVSLATLLLFPSIAYTSVAFYGLPAAAFVLLGFGVWIILQRYQRTLAPVFLIAFGAPVLFCVVPMFFTAAVWLPLAIIAPTALLWLLVK